MYPKMSPQELHVARDVLGYYNLPGGYSPGSFTTAVVRLLEVSDSFNTARTLSAFPEFIPAYTTLTRDGGEKLAEIVAEQSK